MNKSPYCTRSQIPVVALNNGEKIPILGLGTWQLPLEEIGQLIKYAIDVGYRHFDCAFTYQNEKEIGEAIAEKIAEGVVKRQELFITSKCLNPELIEDSLKNTLTDLRLDYLDLYMIHFPIGIKMVANEMVLTDHDYVDTWLTMEKLYQKGLVKSLGVCNFNKRQIERILQRATVLPMTNQIECHPYLNQKKLYDFCKANNIILTAHTPLGSSSATAMEKLNLHNLFDNPQIRDIAGRYGKSSAQVLIRYQIERGVIVIPKSTHKDRIFENSQVFDFVLSADDMALIEGLDVHARLGMVDVTGPIGGKNMEVLQNIMDDLGQIDNHQVAAEDIQVPVVISPLDIDGPKSMASNMLENISMMRLKFTDEQASVAKTVQFLEENLQSWRERLGALNHEVLYLDNLYNSISKVA